MNASDNHREIKPYKTSIDIDFSDFYDIIKMLGDYIIVSAMVMLLYLNGYWRIR